MMERRIKERLIGATILVVLVVLIVPEMLSGPSPRPPTAPPLTDGLPVSNRTVEVDLSTSKTTAAADPADASSAAIASGVGGAAAAPESPAASAAAGDSEVSTLRAQKPADSPLERAPSPPISGVTAASPRAAPAEGGSSLQGRRGWSVQLGSFASRANAEKLVHQLGAHGGSPLYVSASGAGPSLRYRVRMGPLADRGAAERAAGKLRASGHAATIVAPAS